MYYRTRQRRKIYLQPIGELYGPSLDNFREFIGSYFQLEAIALPPVKIVQEGDEISILKEPWSYPITTKLSKDFPGFSRQNFLMNKEIRDSMIKTS